VKHYFLLFEALVCAFTMVLQ